MKSIIKYSLAVILAVLLLPAAVFAKETVVYGDGMALDYYPPVGTSTKSVGIMCVHGGGWTSGAKENLICAKTAQFFAEMGYPAISINYHLWPNWTSQDTAINDVVNAYDWFKTKVPNIHVMGASSGSHLLLMAGPRIDPKSMILLYPPTNLTTISGYDNIWQNKQAYSPYYNVTRGDMADIVIYHATFDPVIPVKQSVDYCQLYNARGNYCKLEKQYGLEHGFLNARTDGLLNPLNDANQRYLWFIQNVWTQWLGARFGDTVGQPPIDWAYWGY